MFSARKMTQKELSSPLGFLAPCYCVEHESGLIVGKNLTWAEAVALKNQKIEEELCHA